jgi:hypothetical protein
MDFDSIKFDSLGFDSIEFDSLGFDSMEFDSLGFDFMESDSLGFDSLDFDMAIEKPAKNCIRSKQRNSVSCLQQRFRFSAAT